MVSVLVVPTSKHGLRDAEESNQDGCLVGLAPDHVTSASRNIISELISR